MQISPHKLQKNETILHLYVMLNYFHIFQKRKILKFLMTTDLQHEKDTNGCTSLKMVYVIKSTRALQSAQDFMFAGMYLFTYRDEVLKDVTNAKLDMDEDNTDQKTTGYR